MKKLPIGIQSFIEIRTENYYYVDKTPFVKMLVDGGKYYFLSRPRRFGKSLFLDTIKQAFLARKDLFKGLYLENNWDWSQPHPVIHISFGSGVYRKIEELEETQMVILQKHAEDYKISFKTKSIKNRFLELIEKLHKTTGKKVVILIDEYDKPILDNIDDKEKAVQMRESLKNFYSVIKDSDEHIKLVFITGVTKFSKVSIFSGLNNLNDITLDPNYGTICGYTQEELEQVFRDRLQGVNLEEVKLWYNGYNWLSEKVYNPFDILLYLDKKDFRPYWFETGTPTFLIKLLMKEKYYIPELENLQAGDEIVESFDIDRVNAVTLLFQTGYLTIKDVYRIGSKKIYTLSYPNLEVKAALTDHILNYIVENLQDKVKVEVEIAQALQKGDMEKLEEGIKRLFASIPNDWYRKNNMSEYEGFYSSVFYAYIAALGLDMVAEDVTNKGRIDLTVKFGGRCYIFEFKVVEKEAEGKALEQIKEMKYYEKHMGKCREIYLIGVEFSKKDRNIVSFKYKKV